MEAVRTPKFKVEYQGKDITGDISKYLVSFEYTDNTGETSDELTIVVEDTLALWRGDWLPAKGDKIKASLGYENEMVECGTFEVDEIEFSGPPDTVSIRALAAGITNPIRTKSSKAYENQTLRQIADDIAGKHGYQVIDLNTSGSALNDIRVERVTQNREADLSFLKRISCDYGIMFSLRDTKLVFTSIYDVEKADGVLELDRTDLISYSIKDVSVKTYKSARVRHHNPKDNTVVSGSVDAQFIYGGGETPASKDTLEVHAKAENPKQAELKAKAALHMANSRQKEGSISVEGNPVLIAGNNIYLNGMNSLSGTYHVTKSSHKIDRGGYITDADIKYITATKSLVPNAKKSKATGKPKSQPSTFIYQQ